MDSYTSVSAPRGLHSVDTSPLGDINTGVRQELQLLVKEGRMVPLDWMVQHVGTWCCMVQYERATCNGNVLVSD
jgi:hypothetical protein